MVKIIYAGTRHATTQHTQQIHRALGHAVADLHPSERLETHLLITGNGRGADQIARQTAKHWGWAIEDWDADWDIQDDGDPEANAAWRALEMITAHQDAHLLLAMPGRGLDSGTSHAIRFATKYNIPTNIRPIKM